MSSSLAKLGDLGLLARSSIPGYKTAEWAVLTTHRLFTTAYTLLIFAYACFFRPIGKKDGDQQARLDAFYETQAQVYDATRTRLLKGRNTLLRLCAANLREMKRTTPNKPLVWVDIGGGTGFNIEEMDAFFPISEFDAVYLVDLCEPLLDVARLRFKARGWKNVHILCQDATFFTIPKWEQGDVEARGSISLFTMSYSLSMIPSYFALLNRIDTLLDPSGLLGVVDFYTSSRASTPLERAIGNGNERRTTFFARWFWQIWFDLDHVSLSASRREYLEYRFGTIKSYNGRNRILPFVNFVQIPYYVWVGCSRSRSTAEHINAFEIEAGNTAGSGHLTPRLSPTSSEASDTSTVINPTVDVASMPELDLGPAVLPAPISKEVAMKTAVPLPWSSFHYCARQWRVPFLEKKEHGEFRTWIYGFTWEDPEVDVKHLELTKDDTLFVITSAGDNALHYAITAQPKRIHCVDMNPCQGHLLELKLAAATALTRAELWDMFGNGKIDNFELLLDTRLSPYLSSPAYQFWRANASAFRKGFHWSGYSGDALRIAAWAFKLGGVSAWVEKFALASTIEEQAAIWNKHLRPVILAPWIAKLVFGNPVFLWNALGVPINQMNCFLKEGVSVAQYAADTLDPIARSTHMRTGAYHYLLCLLGRYITDSCPLYLTPGGLETLKERDGAVLDAFRLHTDSIGEVLRGLAPESITKMVVMDHMDWFDPTAKAPCPLDEEIAHMHRVLARSGSVFWRSAARKPWYIANFKAHGFRVAPLAIRHPNASAPIDRVNMYASFYRADKL